MTHCQKDVLDSLYFTQILSDISMETGPVPVSRCKDLFERTGLVLRIGNGNRSVSERPCSKRRKPRDVECPKQ